MIIKHITQQHKVRIYIKFNIKHNLKIQRTSNKHNKYYKQATHI